MTTILSAVQVHVGTLLATTFDPNTTKNSVFETDAFKLIQKGFYILGMYLALKYAYEIFRDVAAGKAQNVMKTVFKAAILVTFCFNIKIPFNLFDNTGSIFAKLIDSVSKVFGS